MSVSTIFSTAASTAIVLRMALEDHRAYALADVIDSMGASPSQRRTIIRALNALTADGIVTRSEPKHGRPTYQVSRKHYLFDEIRSIAVKTLGGTEAFIDAVRHDDNVISCLIFGSFAAGTARSDSDIDLLLVLSDSQDASVLRTLGLLDEASYRIGRRLNPVTTSPAIWARRKVRGDPFVSRLEQEPVIVIKGGRP